MSEAGKAWYRNVYLKSDEWRELRAIKLQMSPKCEECGINEYLDVHHIRYKNLNDVRIGDLATLCRTCHHIKHVMGRSVNYWSPHLQAERDAREESGRRMAQDRVHDRAWRLEKVQRRCALGNGRFRLTRKAMGFCRPSRGGGLSKEQLKILGLPPVYTAGWQSRAMQVEFDFDTLNRLVM